jgi:hypothetical protein
VGRHVVLPAPEEEALAKWDELSEYEILVRTRKSLLTMISSIEGAVVRGDVYPQLARELHQLTGKVKQLSSEIRQLKKDAASSAKKTTPERRRAAIVQLYKELPLAERRDLLPVLQEAAESGGLSL